jgi:hypothetical protein
MSTQRITLSAFAFTVLITAAGATVPAGAENGKTSTPRGETFLFADCELSDINQRVAALYKKSLATALTTDDIAPEIHHETGQAADRRSGQRSTRFQISTTQQTPLAAQWAVVWHPNRAETKLWPLAGAASQEPQARWSDSSFGATQVSVRHCRLTQGTIHPFQSA